MLKKVLLMLLCVTVFVPIAFDAAPACAEIQDWLPDSDKWQGKQSKGLLGKIKDFINDVIDNIVGFKEAVVSFLKDQIDRFTGWVVENVIYFGNVLLEKFLWLLDWFLQTAWDFFFWLIDQFPEIEISENFELGMQFFIGYCYLMNRIVPIPETLAWIAFYVTTLTVVTAYRIIKSLIPGIAT